jgi:hypothetical protein
VTAGYMHGRVMAVSEPLLGLDKRKETCVVCVLYAGGWLQLQPAMGAACGDKFGLFGTENARLIAR